MNATAPPGAPMSTGALRVPTVGGWVVVPVFTIGTHQHRAGDLAKGLRNETRPPVVSWQRRGLDVDTAKTELAAWLTGWSLDADAVCPVPSHDLGRGPGHTTAEVVTDTLGVPTELLCRRHSSTWSAHVDQRSTWPLHRHGLNTDPTSPARRVAVVDNAIATGHSAIATVVALTDAGHQVTAVIAASHTNPRKERSL